MSYEPFSFGPCRIHNEIPDLQSKIVDKEWGGPRVFYYRCIHKNCPRNIGIKVSASIEGAEKDWNRRNEE